jgi:hypothetical protein
VNKPIPFEGIGFLTTALYLLTILLDFDVALSQMIIQDIRAAKRLISMCRALLDCCQLDRLLLFSLCKSRNASIAGRRYRCKFKLKKLPGISYNVVCLFFRHMLPVRTGEKVRHKKPRYVA